MRSLNKIILFNIIFPSISYSKYFNKYPIISLIISLPFSIPTPSLAPSTSLAPSPTLFNQTPQKICRQHTIPHYPYYTILQIQSAINTLSPLYTIPQHNLMSTHNSPTPPLPNPPTQFVVNTQSPFYPIPQNNLLSKHNSPTLPLPNPPKQSAVKT